MIMNMPKISSTIMCWNESKTIDLALKSLAGWAYEVIIVDTGSFDGTQKIAREWLDELNLSGQIIQMSKAFMNERKKATSKLQKARLVGYDACEGDWVLMHDACFAATEGLKRNLVEHTKNSSNYHGNIVSLNLMGDYGHYFKNRAWMEPHKVFVRKGTKHVPGWVSLPGFVGEAKTIKNWVVSLSRVRPAWRYYCRGEQFDRRYYKPPQGDWQTRANIQNHWAKESFTPSLVEYLEETEGLTFEDIKKKAPEWMLRQLRLEATPLTKDMRNGLPEVIKEELKDPRYKIIYEKGEIVGRWPEL